MNAFIVTVAAGLLSFNVMAAEPAKKDEKKQEVKAAKQSTPANAEPAAPAAKK